VEELYFKPRVFEGITSIVDERMLIEFHKRSEERHAKPEITVAELAEAQKETEERPAKLIEQGATW